MFQVKTKQFEGPLHLLLELIENQKLDITRVSLTHVADDFLAHIEKEKGIGLGSLSEFLLISSQLILLKSKALLPIFEFTQEEEEDLEDLQQRLIEYQKFQKISEEIGKARELNKISFSRDEERTFLSVFIPQDISSKYLNEVYVNILQEVPAKEDLAEHVMEEVVSLEEKIVQLKDTIEKRMKIAFHETVEQAESKVDVVVTFLAMLEMIKQRIVSVQQSEMFGEIIIKKNTIKEKTHGR
ncbi:MAG: ScpA family protein [Patescibacteria group bacterium]|nr:ScpA family protein [Patescibacteria group bacterium]